MLETRKNAIKFNSSNGVNQIAGYWFENEGVRPKAILQISHGMCEYFLRYEEFAVFMAQHGYLVCGTGRRAFLPRRMAPIIFCATYTK